jgi:hypothetical protein
VALGNGIVDRLAIIHAVCRQRGNADVDLMKQIRYFGNVADIVSVRR